MPKLKLIDNTKGGVKPPRPLGKAGMRLWRAVTAEYRFGDAPGIEMLALACAALDRAEACAEQIDKQGEMIRMKIGARENPLCRIELQNRFFVVRVLEKLGLNAEQVKPVGRPAGAWNYARTKTRERISTTVSDSAAETFRKALRLRDHRESQIVNPEACPGVGTCETCDEYERLVAVVSGELGLAPWDIHPIDVGDVPPPPHWDDQRQAAWDRARAQHVRLCEAAKIAPVRKLRLTDVDRGIMNSRWIERTALVPDGPDVGKPFRLRPFQT